MSNQTTTHHGPAGPGPGSGPQETGIDGLAHLVDDLAHAMATTPEAVLAGMSDDVLNALFRLHVQAEPAHGPRPDGVLEPGRNRATR
ncbi:hypothetical protein ABZZ36_42675 [Actinacidiphila glaucinigra]|uniref:hypothetical protein n=1 Tax=Actinacidiphila glaucinigra TaxID=235986 RepID=UPI0033A0EFAE